MAGAIGMGFGSTDLSRGFEGHYASPHATIGIKDVPTNIKQVMRLCRYYFMQDALLGALVDKMSEYPITRVVITEKDTLSERAREKWEHILEVSLNIRSVLKSINMDKYIFGNSFFYLYLPFVRYCRCRSCGHVLPIGGLDKIRMEPQDMNGHFSLRVHAACPRCSGGSGERVFDVEDRKSEARNGVRLVRLNPLRMELEYNPVTGARDWYWNPPQTLRLGMMANVRSITDTTEMRVLEAAFREQKIRMNRDRLWVAQADGIPGIWEGWGIPPLFRVLEDVYYYKVLRRANEALAQEHVTPLRILSPAGTGDISPQRSVNLSDWQNRMRRELFRWKRDPNHITLSPMPLNIEQVGGQARVMMVASEMEAAARVIAAGIGCPIEMIWGGLNWSGASVSLRVLENHFINDRENCERLLTFLIPKLAAYMRLPRITTELADFKMADDVQHQANAINLMLQGFLSRKSVITDMNFDNDEEFKNLEEEHERLNRITMKDNIEAAHMNTVIMALEQKAQILLQYELQLVEQNIQLRAERTRLQDLANHVSLVHEQGYSTPHEFDQSAMVLQGLDPAMQQMILQQWQQSMPTVVALLLHKLQADQEMIDQVQMAQDPGYGMEGEPEAHGAVEGAGMPPGAGGPYDEGQDPELAGIDEPLPEQRPPRREESPI